MPQPEPNDVPAIQPTACACRHLRNKGMYVYTDASDEGNEGYDSGAYWCLKTLKNFGPDDDMVGGAECRDPSRSCYEPI
jgi:hypothetical protein